MIQAEENPDLQAQQEHHGAEGHDDGDSGLHDEPKEEMPQRRSSRRAAEKRTRRGGNGIQGVGNIVHIPGIGDVDISTMDEETLEALTDGEALNWQQLKGRGNKRKGREDEEDGDGGEPLPHPHQLQHAQALALAQQLQNQHAPVSNGQEHAVEHPGDLGEQGQQEIGEGEEDDNGPPRKRGRKAKNPLAQQQMPPDLSPPLESLPQKGKKGAKGRKEPREEKKGKKKKRGMDDDAAAMHHLGMAQRQQLSYQHQQAFYSTPGFQPQPVGYPGPAGYPLMPQTSYPPFPMEGQPTVAATTLTDMSSPALRILNPTMVNVSALPSIDEVQAERKLSPVFLSQWAKDLDRVLGNALNFTVGRVMPLTSTLEEELLTLQSTGITSQPSRDPTGRVSALTFQMSAFPTGPYLHVTLPTAQEAPYPAGPVHYFIEAGPGDVLPPEILAILRDSFRLATNKLPNPPRVYNLASTFSNWLAMVLLAKRQLAMNMPINASAAPPPGTAANPALAGQGPIQPPPNQASLVAPPQLLQQQGIPQQGPVQPPQMPPQQQVQVPHEQMQQGDVGLPAGPETVNA